LPLACDGPDASMAQQTAPSSTTATVPAVRFTAPVWPPPPAGPAHAPQRRSGQQERE
jgi:hypothetical protein